MGWEVGDVVGVGETVAALVGGLKADSAAEVGVGGEAVVVLWCRRRGREVAGDARGVIARGARKSRMAGASGRGESSRVDMVGVLVLLSRC